MQEMVNYVFDINIKRVGRSVPVVSIYTGTIIYREYNLNFKIIRFDN